MESPAAYPESPLDPDEAAIPCKGCGEILEEGKAFELAGNRWHIDCFRCNTCGTLLDGDANLLLLGDGSLICNNCTYSCSNCGNKIEDLAILTGDQAFCATCFKCRNCKKKIENLRYARTSQGIFCMDCHEALMARRRKKTQKSAAQRQKLTNNGSHLDKSLPSLPPSEAHKHAFSPSTDSPPPSYSSTLVEAPSLSKQVEEMRKAQDTERRDRSPAGSGTRENLTLPSASFQEPRHSVMSQRSDQSGAEEFLIPMAFDPTPQGAPSPQLLQQKPPERSRDYFGSSRPTSDSRHGESISSVNKGASPHIMFQEKGRQASGDIADPLPKGGEDSTSRSGSRTASPQIAADSSRGDTQRPQLARDASYQSDKFRLQEAPKTKRSSGSARDSGSQATTPRADLLNGSAGYKAPTTPTIQEPEDMYEQEGQTPQGISYEYSPVASTESPKPLQHQQHQHLQNLPKRGDSLDSAKRNKTIPRKEINAAANIPQAFSDLGTSAQAPPTDPTDLSRLNGGKIISHPIESPMSKSIFDTPNTQSSRTDKSTSAAPKESFTAPRAPPQPPSDHSRTRNESLSAVAETPRTGEAQISPTLPRWSGGGDFTLEEDMARILGGDEPTAHESFLRRVSNSVRHGRSYSDRSTRVSRDRWPRSPGANNALGNQEISSPSTASPENRDELAWFKNELRRERQKTVERERKIAELEAALDSTANIKQVNADLKEKRSTMVVLDAQKEIVVRELEVLTEHIAAAKKSGEPLDLSKMSNTIIREFAESLQKLRDSFSPQIEDSIQKRNDLMDEITNLTSLKDKSFQEFQQLSDKNAQLAEINNQLVHQIQGLYKANAGPGAEPAKSPQVTNGLGIYSHHKDKSQFSIDSRQLSEQSVPGSGTTLQAEEQEAAAAVIQGPHVVNIRKGQAKKFNWKKEGKNVAKGVTKGLKGAFSSTQQNYGRDLQFTETAPYGTAPIGQEYSSLPRNNQEPVKQSFGLFGNQKMPQKVNGLFKQANSSTPSLLLDASTYLYGSDLEQRAEFERAQIPLIVTRCIDEVEARGMDVEGIYRKSGGNSQVQAVREGFERSLPDFDLSDPDLDIHAVTSGLKQYFRKLPTPLITFDVYDKLLDTTSITDHSTRIESMRQSLKDLPRVHYDVLEYLMKHLKRVVQQEKENLMTSMNIAVVFAPTIMRPESLGRELTDTKNKNEVVMWMVDNVNPVFQNAYWPEKMAIPMVIATIFNSFDDEHTETTASKSSGDWAEKLIMIEALFEVLLCRRVDVSGATQTSATGVEVG